MPPPTPLPVSVNPEIGAGLPSGITKPIAPDIQRPDISAAITQKQQSGESPRQIFETIASGAMGPYQTTATENAAYRPESTTNITAGETSIPETKEQGAVKDEKSENNQSTQGGMQEWESKHALAADASPDILHQWTVDRANMEKQLVVTAMVKEDMNQWHAKNPEPDNKNTEAHQKWEEQRTQANQKAMEQRSREYESDKKKKQEEEQGMSEAEFMEKARQLQELRQTATTLSMDIMNLSFTDRQTDTVRAAIKQCQQSLDIVKAQIDALQAELQVDVNVSGPKKKFAKQILLPIIIAAGAVATPAMAEMQRESK